MKNIKTYVIVFIVFLTGTLIGSLHGTEQKAAVPILSDFRRESEVLSKEWRDKLKILSQDCLSKGMRLESQITERYISRSNDVGFSLLKIPSTQRLIELPDDATEDQQHWYRRLNEYCSEYGKKYFQLGERALAAREGGEARRLYYLALSIDSDHKEARRRCGYSFKEGEWRTQYERRQLEKGFVDHPHFGWIPKEQIERYEKGERYFLGRWLSAEEETKQRRTKRIPWRIETEHYQLLTTISFEEGVRIARALEDYYSAWTRLFYPLMATDRQWSTVLLNGRILDSRRHKVQLFYDRESYQEALARVDASLAVDSPGSYFQQVRTIYICLPKEEERDLLNTILIHEATHQLFQECRFAPGSTRYDKQGIRPFDSNFWVIEGIATYMETFSEDERYFHIGGTHSPRIQRAMERSVESGGYLPLREYVGLSIDQFQQNAQLPMLYTQAAGLAFFFLHYEGGKYRTAFIGYLYSVYERFDTPNILEKLTGTSLEALDKEYRAFMSSQLQTLQ